MTWEQILSDSQLKEKFVKALRHNYTADLSNESMNDLYIMITKKVFHARSAEIIDKFIDCYISKSAQCLRTHLEAKCEDEKKRKRTKINK